MLLVLGGLLGTAAEVRAAGRTAADYEKLEFSYPERASSQRQVDVDGDGKLDLMWVFERSPQSAKNPSYALRTCTFEPAPRFSKCRDLELATDVRAYDVAEVDGLAGAELLLVTDSGGRLHSFDEGFLPVRNLSLNTLLTATDMSSPVSIRAFFDLDSDGRHELVVPTISGPAIIRFDANHESNPQLLKSPATVKYRLGRNARELGRAVGRTPARGVITQTVSPPLFVEDFDGDGRPDIVTTVETRVRVFAQRADGTFPSEATHDREISVVSEEEGERGFTGEAASFADLDGDGLSDLIILKWGSSQERTRMDRHLFFARPGLEYPDEADQIIRSESVFPDFEMRDLNGDGRLDLVIPYFHVAPAQAFKVITQNALRVQLRLFLMRENGRFGQDEGKSFAKVDRRVVVDYKLNMARLIFGNGSPPDGFSPLLNAQGDFDSDGFADLANDSGDDALHLRFGNEDGVYSKNADLAISHESSVYHELVDLNGDGRTDVVSYYGGPSQQDDDNVRSELRRNKRSAPSTPVTQDDEGPPARSRIRILLSR
ncbi:MAG: VCBS repeat-containing protein [Myxococcota bacterium]|nr:VCBS repeat-containing protein [Myxococcota bacterium]